MILRGPEKEAELIEKRTGISTKAAFDGMHITFGQKIYIGKPKRQVDLSSFMGQS
jgi:hypothetical protein